MSLLFPLYLVALGTLAAPIVLHMLRRTASGRTPFSATLFLRSSRPRLVRRQRLQHLPLLLLRALILALLALAFARPYLQSESQVTAAENQERHIAVVVDTSASMRRSGLRESLLAELEALATENLGATFELMTFDAQVRHLGRFDAQGLGPAVAEIEFSFGNSEVGAALVEAAERLIMDAGDEAQRRVVLVTDMQAGSRLDALETYEWPEDLVLEVRRLKSELSNAGLHFMPGGDDEQGTSVRVSNAADATLEEFLLSWANGAAAVGEARTVHCPAGAVRVVQVPVRPEGADRIVLTGDQADFDNTLFVLADERPIVRVVSFGGQGERAGAESEPADSGSLDFFLGKVFDDDRTRFDAGVELPLDPLVVPLVVWRPAAGDTRADELSKYAAEGGTLLVVLGTGATADTGGLRSFLGEAFAIREARDGREHALVAEVDFGHPLFRPFADARYSDFTKIRIWRHRTLEGLEPATRVLARFDDGAPWVVEQELGRGRMLVMTTTWESADSDLARSTKFAPLLRGLLQLRRSGDPTRSHVHVGAEVSFGESRFVANEPGRFTIEDRGRRFPITVGVDPEESRTEPFELDPFDRLGVAKPDAATLAGDEERERQELGVETEKRQKIWRWLVLVALGALLIETAWAGRLARRAVLDDADPEDRTNDPTVNPTAE